MTEPDVSIVSSFEHWQRRAAFQCDQLGQINSYNIIRCLFHWLQSIPNDLCLDETKIN